MYFVKHPTHIKQLLTHKSPPHIIGILNISGMTCGSCTFLLERHLKMYPGIHTVVANFLLQECVVNFDSTQISIDTICTKITELGFNATIKHCSVENKSCCTTTLSSISDEVSPISDKHYPTLLNEQLTKQQKIALIQTPLNNTYNFNTLLTTPFSEHLPITHDDVNQLLCRQTNIILDGNHVLTIELSHIKSTYQKEEQYIPSWVNYFYKKTHYLNLDDEIERVLDQLRGSTGINTCIKQSYSKENQKLHDIKLIITYNPFLIGARSIIYVLTTNLPYFTLRPIESDIGEENLIREYNHILHLLILCIPLTLIVLIFMFTPVKYLSHYIIMESIQGISNRTLLMCVAALPIYFVGGWGFHTNALKALRNCYLSMDVLISLSTTFTMIYSMCSMVHRIKNNNLLLKSYQMNESLNVPFFFEAPATVITTILIGKILETRAKRLTYSLMKRYSIKSAENPCYLIIPSNYIETDIYSHLSSIVTTSHVCLQHNDASRNPLFGENITFIPLHPSFIHIGDLLHVPTGSIIPADGIIVNISNILVDESIATGEPFPISKTCGDSVIGGSKLIMGPIQLCVNKIGNQTFMGQIQTFMDSVHVTKSSSQHVADQIAYWFIPFVLLFAIGTTCIWIYLVLHTHILTFSSMTSRMMFISQFPISILSVACPCALGLAIPIAIAIATGRGANFGILIQRLSVLETLSTHITDVVFDKTGTLTTGEFYPLTLYVYPIQEWNIHECLFSKCVSHHCIEASTLPSYHLENPIKCYFKHHQNWEKIATLSSKQLYTLTFFLWILELLEQDSVHPIGKSVSTFCKKILYYTHNTHTQGYPALINPTTQNKHSVGGVSGYLNIALWFQYIKYSTDLSPMNNTQYQVHIGNALYMTDILGYTSVDTFYSDVAFQTTIHDMSSFIFVAINQSCIGFIELVDDLKKEVKSVIECLKEYYHMTIWMCTGDSMASAIRVGNCVGIDHSHIRSNMTPEDKAEFITCLQKETNLQKKNSFKHCMMIGDGINDGPALSVASVGIGLGSRIYLTMTASDVIFINENLTGILTLLNLSNYTVKTIRRNYLWVFCFNLITLPIASGICYPIIVLPPAIAGMIMALSSLVVIGNSFSLFLFKQWSSPTKSNNILCSEKDEQLQCLTSN